MITLDQALDIVMQLEKAYRKFVRRQPHLQKRIDDALRQMATDLAAPALQTHKLSGNLAKLEVY